MNSNSWTGDLRSQNQLCKALVFGVEALFNGFGTLTRFNRTGAGYSTQNAFTGNGHLGSRGLTIHGKAPDRGLLEELYHNNESCQQADNPAPAFNESGDFVDIEFHRTEQPEGVAGSEKSSEKSSEKPELLDLIQANPKASAKVLAEQLGLSSRAVEKQIAQLKQQGKLERIGPAKGGYWRVKV